MRLLFALVACALPVVGCGGEPAPTDPGQDFKRALGQTCTSFYAEAGELQARLEALDITAASSSAEDREALLLVDQIQARSGQFLDDLRELPEPIGEGPQEDFAALIESTERFLDVQSEMFDSVERILDGTASSADQLALAEGRSQLDEELADQQAVLARLDAPECLPQ